MLHPGCRKRQEHDFGCAVLEAAASRRRWQRSVSGNTCMTLYPLAGMKKTWSRLCYGVTQAYQEVYDDVHRNDVILTDTAGNLMSPQVVVRLDTYDSSLKSLHSNTAQARWNRSRKFVRLFRLGAEISPW
jgi:hypothetical protein